MSRNSRELLFVGDSGRIYRTSKDQMRIGITSRLGRKHFVLLDFDKYNIDSLTTHLKKIQLKFHLPNIYIFMTSRNKYSVMCFKLMKWWHFKRILFDADIDPNHRYYTIMKKEATLRISPKAEKPSNLKLVDVLKGRALEDVKLKDTVFNIMRLEHASLC